MSFDEAVSQLWEAVCERYEAAPRGSKPANMYHTIAKYKQDNKKYRPKVDRVIEFARYYGIELEFTVKIK